VSAFHGDLFLGLDRTGGKLTRPRNATVNRMRILTDATMQTSSADPAVVERGFEDLDQPVEQGLVEGFAAPTEQPGQASSPIQPSPHPSVEKLRTRTVYFLYDTDLELPR